eukprot:CAMPEP_0197526398 /NCGR_PEP_ID=MMETSP1318-20131121/17688_1 /TAXON_ID=552666 /ORGANISM="Partenskyella glossopodia, Strain RCC365" /LENGTH=340 /DNA_ID=CAMNT_0043080545 /DNA_START=128 /DNA_END=1150 /DNA_ORIENTATION=+
MNDTKEKAIKRSKGKAAHAAAASGRPGGGLDTRRKRSLSGNDLPPVERASSVIDENEILSLEEASQEEDQDSLAATLECPVCLITFCEKVFVCANGHSICESCYGKIKTRCPTCRVALRGARNRALEAVIAHACLPCKYQEYGCDFKGKGKARSKHMAKCVHHPIRCLFHRCYPQCKWSGPPSELMDHLNTHSLVRRVGVGVQTDVYWSYESKENCFQRGKDATFFITNLERFYYVSLTRHDGQFHLGVVWLPTTEAGAVEDSGLTMELVVPLVDGQSIHYTLKPPRINSDLMMDENITNLINSGQTYIVPIRKWRSQWMEERGKFYFRIRAMWFLKNPE